MKLMFIGARRVNPDRDGFDFQFFYRVDEESESRKIHVVISSNGAELAWNISQQDEYEYAKRVFAVVVPFIKNYWNRNRLLPEQDVEYYEKDHFAKISDNKLNWEQFEIDLN